MNFSRNKLICSGSVLFLTGFLAGCATPDNETVARASQLQAQALGPEVQKAIQTAENCRSEAILAGLKSKPLTFEQPSKTILVSLSTVPATGFAFAEVAPEISDEDVGVSSDAGNKDGEGIGPGQGHDVGFGESC